MALSLGFSTQTHPQGLCASLMCFPFGAVPHRPQNTWLGFSSPSLAPLFSGQAFSPLAPRLHPFTSLPREGLILRSTPGTWPPNLPHYSSLHEHKIPTQLVPTCLGSLYPLVLLPRTGLFPQSHPPSTSPTSRVKLSSPCPEAGLIWWFLSFGLDQ